MHPSALVSVVLAAVVPLSAGAGRVAVDPVLRAISIRFGDRMVRLIGVEPIAGAEGDARPSRELERVLEDLVGDRPLRFEFDPDADESVRREAGYAFLPDGRVVNEEIVRRGYARAPMTPKHPRRARFLALQSAAIAERAGLWSEISVVHPSETGGGPAAGEADEAVSYKVFYATDRRPTGSRAVNESYGAEEGNGVSYGSCLVSLPRDRRYGPAERPAVWTVEVRLDPARKAVLLSVEEKPKERLFEDLSRTIALSQRKEALVFVHGYDVTFPEAARRTAQLAYDLAFDGAPIAWAWPSRGTVEGYLADASAVERTVPRLRAFLEDAASRSGAAKIHLVAHSMGARALGEALRLMGAEGEGRPSARFGQVVLAAPDVDAARFREAIAPAIRGLADRITLYASSRDGALGISRRINGAARAGESGPGMAAVDGIDVVDVSAVDTSLAGHAYYRSNESVVGDLFLLIREGKPPEERPGLSPGPACGAGCWVLAPPASPASVPG